MRIAVTSGNYLFGSHIQRIRLRELLGIRLTLLNSVLTGPGDCSYFVLMSIETLGEAYRLSWRVRVRCVRATLKAPFGFGRAATKRFWICRRLSGPRVGISR